MSIRLRVMKIECSMVHPVIREGLKDGVFVSFPDTEQRVITLQSVSRFETIRDDVVLTIRAQRDPYAKSDPPEFAFVLGAEHLLSFEDHAP